MSQQHSLSNSGIVKGRIENYAEAFFNPKGTQAAMSSALPLTPNHSAIHIAWKV